MKKKPTAQEILNRIAEIDADARYHYSAADFQINGPLALIQVDMKAEINALSWVAGIKAPKFGPKKK